MINSQCLKPTASERERKRADGNWRVMRDFKREGYWERQWNIQGHTESGSWRKSPNKRFPVSLSISRH